MKIKGHNIGLNACYVLSFLFIPPFFFKAGNGFDTIADAQLIQNGGDVISYGTCG